MESIDEYRRMEVQRILSEDERKMLQDYLEDSECECDECERVLDEVEDMVNEESSMAVHLRGGMNLSDDQLFIYNHYEVDLEAGTLSVTDGHGNTETYRIIKKEMSAPAPPSGL